MGTKQKCVSRGSERAEKVRTLISIETYELLSSKFSKLISTFEKDIDSTDKLALYLIMICCVIYRTSTSIYEKPSLQNLLDPKSIAKLKSQQEKERKVKSI